MSNQPCPKCGYVRQPSDSHTMEGICPACGIAIAKWLAAQNPPTEKPHEELEDDWNEEEALSRFQQLKAYSLYVPERIDPWVLYGRAGIFAVFFIWGWSFILGGIDWESIGGSFLHQVILPFHEFGHVLFSPFGRFMSILGGSLFQVLMPLGLMVAFMIKQRDNFGASMMLWWSGQSFIDVSPYIADAKNRLLPLIGGMGEEAHDWGNLLRMTGTLDSAMTFARMSFLIGTLLMLASWAWGAYLLYKQYRVVQETNSAFG